MVKVMDGPEQVLKLLKEVIELKLKVIKKANGVGSEEGSIAYWAVQSILNKQDFEATLKIVKKHYPDSNFSKNCFYWYRRYLGPEHENVLVRK